MGLKFNPTKIEHQVTEVSYVVHLFTSQGLKQDPKKIRAVKEMPASTHKEGVLRLLGTVNYLDKFIEHKANLQGPISMLVQKDKVLEWTDCQ